MTAAVLDALAAAGREVAAAHRTKWPPVVRWAPIDEKLEVAVLEGDEAEALEAISTWRWWWLTRGSAWDGPRVGDRALACAERRERERATDVQLQFDLEVTR